MGEMVGDQTANQAANPLKKGKIKKTKREKKNHQFWNYRIVVLVFLMLLL
jgi:hypothetical protein